MTTSPEILGLGCSAVDDLIYIPHYPRADSKLQVTRRERQCGGLTATALVAAAQLSTRAAYGGNLGIDELSSYVMQQLQSSGVDTHWVRRVADAGPIHSTVLIDQHSGGRNIFYDLSRVSALPEDWPEQSVVLGLKVLYVDHFSVEAQTRAARMCHEKGIAIVADFERCDVSGFDVLLSLVDHLILSRDFATALTGVPAPQDAVRALWNDSRRLVAITCGERGCYFACRESESRVQSPEVQHQPALAVDVVDTTGCGDVFHGAYAAALVHGLRIRDAIRFAAAAAALKATRRGGQAGAPTLDEVKSVIGD